LSETDPAEQCFDLPYAIVMQGAPGPTAAGPLDRADLSDLISREIGPQFQKQILGFGKPKAKIVWGGRRQVSIERGDLDAFG
jgi:hypothetical protein